MRPLRLAILALIGFFSAFLGNFFAPGAWGQRVVAAALCGVLSYDSAACQVNLPVLSLGAAAMGGTPAVAQSVNSAGEVLLADRANEFDDNPNTPATPGNVTPPPYPLQPGPNQPLRAPDFGDSDSGRTPNVPVPRNISFQDDGAGNATFTLVDQDGCSRKYDFKSDGNKSHIESVTFDLPANESNLCNNLSTQMYAKFTPDGKEVIFSSSNDAPPVKIQGIDGRIWTITYTDESGNKIVKQVSLEVIGQSKQPKQFMISREVEYDKSKIHELQVKKTYTSDFILAKWSKTDCESVKAQCEQGLWVKRNLEPITKSLTAILSSPFLQFFTSNISKTILATAIALAINVLPEVSSLECTTLFGDKYASDQVNKWRQDNKNIQDWMDENRKSSGCDDHVAQCGQQQVSGGQAGDTRTIQLTAKKGKINVSYEMFDVPDQLIVRYEGRVIINTGFVSDSSTVSADFDGNSDQVEVEVIGNRQQSSTKWNYTLSCPQ